MIYKSLIHLLSSNILLLFPLSSVFLFISFKSLFKFEKNKIFLKSKKILPFEIKNHVQEIIVCYIPVLFSTAYILYFGTYSDFILLFLGSLNFFALILLSDKKIKTQLAKNKKILLNMFKWEFFVFLVLFFVFLVLFMLNGLFYGAIESSLYTLQLSRNFLPIINELNSIIYVALDLTWNSYLFLLFTALISDSFIVANCALLYIIFPLSKKSSEEN